MTDTESTSSIYIKCLEIMLVPIVKFCLNRSLKIHDLLECVKVVMIQVAKEQVEATGSKVSISKLSVVTGMHRRDASRILKNGGVVSTQPSVMSKVIGIWQESPEYSSASGSPKILTSEGESSEFFSLVRSINTHLNPYTVLFELQRAGAVRKTDSGLELIWEEFTSTDDVVEASKMMSTDTQDLMLAIEDNISNKDMIPHLHLVTEYDNIAPDAEQEIREWMLEAGGLFHKQARKFLSKFDRDTNPDIEEDSGRLRVVVGGFSRVCEFS